MISHNFWVFFIEENTQCGNFIFFIVTQILCEINFGDSRSAKSAILTHLETLDFDFHEFLHFFEGWNFPNQQTSQP